MYRALLMLIDGVIISSLLQVKILSMCLLSVLQKQRFRQQSKRGGANGLTESDDKFVGGRQIREVQLWRLVRTCRQLALRQNYRQVGPHQNNLVSTTPFINLPLLTANLFRCSALIQLLQDCIRNDIGLRHTDLVMKSIWRVLKLMPGWSNQIDYDSVLLEIHFFLKEFPTTWWKSRESDTPLRTIKTILHATVKQRGASICLHMSKIPNTKESELEAYINKLIKVTRRSL